MGRDFDDLKDGSRLEPIHINLIYKELRRWRKLRITPPGVIQGAADGEGIPEIVLYPQQTRYLGVANGTITARVNTTVGVGFVTVKKLDANSSTIETAQVGDLTVYNASNSLAVANTTTSINSGVYVWVERDPFGTWWVGPLEC